MTIMNEALYNFYANPQDGSGLPVFTGSKRHLHGGGFFGTLLRGAIPILKAVGRRAIGVASRGADQYLSGKKDFIPAMTDEIGAEASNLLKRGLKRKAKPRKGPVKRSSINKRRTALDR